MVSGVINATETRVLWRSRPAASPMRSIESQPAPASDSFNFPLKLKSAPSTVLSAREKPNALPLMSTFPRTVLPRLTLPSMSIVPPPGSSWPGSGPVMVSRAFIAWRRLSCDGRILISQSPGSSPPLKPMGVRMSPASRRSPWPSTRALDKSV